MAENIENFEISKLYSNEEIYKSLGVGNAGGVRVKTTSTGEVERLVVFTSVPTARQLAENPYHDRLEADVLIYTGAGRVGDQVVSGPNIRLTQQQNAKFPIYGFIQKASRRDPSMGKKRWAFLGLLECQRYYRERQLDTSKNWRDVIVFELRVHSSLALVSRATDRLVMSEILANRSGEIALEDREVIVSESPDKKVTSFDLATLELLRRQMLVYDPRQFEHVIHELLKQSGFDNIEVTKYSQDGGIDVNAMPGKQSWPIQNLLIQLQAKRWLHTVGRKEVAELRGSLHPHAAGCIVTTSHFSRAALRESKDFGKVPITLIDGYDLAEIIMMLDLQLP